MNLVKGIVLAGAAIAGAAWLWIRRGKGTEEQLYQSAITRIESSSVCHDELVRDVYRLVGQREKAVRDPEVRRALLGLWSESFLIGPSPVPSHASQKCTYNVIDQTLDYFALVKGQDVDDKLLKIGRSPDVRLWVRCEALRFLVGMNRGPSSVKEEMDSVCGKLDEAENFCFNNVAPSF